MQSRVDQVNAQDGKVVVVENNYASIAMGDGRRLSRRFLDVPPRPAHPLVGRDTTITELRDRACRGGPAAIIAMFGLPGVGKSSLAVALAYDPAVLDHFRGGVLWASLGPGADAEAVLGRWATALEVDLEGARDGSDRAGRLTAALMERAQGEPLLLVVDDAWTWEQARPFREIALPGCAYVLTTRDITLARRFAGEVTRVSALSHDAAERFLAEGCPEASAADPEGLRELAAAVGGLPLGLSLVAAELRAHEGQARWVRGAIERLKDAEHRLGLEDAVPHPGLADVPATLRAIVELSVAALDSEVQQAFAMLAAFAPKPADFGRDAVLAVWAMEGARGDEVMRGLTERGLLEVAGEDRFTLHQVLSEVAAARQGSDLTARERHAAYHRALVESDREAWQRIEGELDQIRRAWVWACGPAANEEEALAYVHAMVLFFTRRGLSREHLEWMGRGLQAARALNQQHTEAELLNGVGLMHALQGGRERALECFEQALKISRLVGDRLGEAFALTNMSELHCLFSEYGRALELYEKVLTIYRAVGDREREASVLISMGNVQNGLGDRGRALDLYKQVLPLLVAVGDDAEQATTLGNIGDVHNKLGDGGLALEFYNQALKTYRAVGNPEGEAATIIRIGDQHQANGDHGRALECFEQALPLFVALGDRVGQATTLSNIGEVHKELGNHNRALESYEQALTIFRSMGRRPSEVITLTRIGIVHYALGNYRRALEYFEQVLPLYRALSDSHGEAKVLDVINSINNIRKRQGARLLVPFLTFVALAAATFWLVFSD